MIDLKYNPSVPNRWFSQPRYFAIGLAVVFILAAAGLCQAGGPEYALTTDIGTAVGSPAPGDSDAYIGTFKWYNSKNTGTGRTITQMTILEIGTIDASTELSGVRTYTDTDNFVSSAQAGLLDTELPIGSILCLLALIGLLWLGNKKTKGKRPKNKRSTFGIRHTAHGAIHTAQGARPAVQGAGITEHRKPDDKPGTPQLL